MRWKRCARHSLMERSAIDLKLWHNVQNGLKSPSNISVQKFD